MNLDDIPIYQTDINKLKTELKSICEKYEITKFEPDDIVELLEDGEKVDWIVNQLYTENSNIDLDALTSLLTAIRSVVAPPEEDEEDTSNEDEELQILEEEKSESVQETVDAMPDLSQLDLSQLSDLPLPPGMKLPDGVGMEQLQQIMKSPQGEFISDFSLFCQEKGVEITQGSLTDTANIQQLNEEWMNTPREAFDGKKPAEMLAENPSLMPQKVETFRREEPRVGRNDPCPCGSGKKYKKCCGKL